MQQNRLLIPALGGVYRTLWPVTEVLIRVCAGLSLAAHGYSGCCAAIRDLDLYPRLANIQAPTLVVVGESDLSTPLVRGQALVERIQGAKLTLVPSAHIAPTEIPEKYLDAVLPFLKS